MTEANLAQDHDLVTATNIVVGDKIKLFDNWYRCETWRRDIVHGWGASMEEEITITVRREANEYAVKLVVHPGFTFLKKKPDPKPNPACPFCLTETLLEYRPMRSEDKYRLVCPNENCRVMPTGRWCSSEEGAIKRWSPINVHNVSRPVTWW